MLYTTAVEFKKRYEYVAEDGFDDDRIEIAIYDASRYIDAQLAGAIAKLPFANQTELELYPTISQICIWQTYCFMIRDQRARNLITEQESNSLLESCCRPASMLIKQIQMGTATIGMEDEDLTDDDSNGLYLVDTGTDAFDSRT